MPTFPRHHNALQVAEILGPDCFNVTEATAKVGVVEFYSKKGGFSYDPARRRKVGLVSRHLTIERVVSEVEHSGQPLGRPWNAELLREIHAQFKDRDYRCRPLKLQARVIVEGLLLRVPCDFYVVEEGNVILNVLQLSRSEKSRLSRNQARFILSATWHTLAKGDLSIARAALCDLSKSIKGGARDPVWYHLDELGAVSLDELNRVLTIYMRGYSLAIEEGLLPERVYRPARGWEEDQYRFF
jgi:hypothetical protein